MEIMKKILVLVGIVTMTFACSKSSESPYQQIYVKDFHSEDIEQCKPSDVNLSHHQAREFFLHAKAVPYKVIHDHYPVAPCYIEGTMQYQAKSCDWNIRPGGTGQIKCQEDILYFVCDRCDHLFSGQ